MPDSVEDVDALRQVEGWPCTHAAVAVVYPDGSDSTHGEVDLPLRWASVTKLATAVSALVAVEEGIVLLDDPAGPPGSTLRHLLAHASGLPFEGLEPVARPGTRRIYSNGGIELAAEHVARAAGMPFPAYFEAVWGFPLDGSPAHGVQAAAHDPARARARAPATEEDRARDPRRGGHAAVPRAGRRHPGRRPVRPERLGPRPGATRRQAPPLDGHTELACHVRPLRRRRRLRLGRSRGRRRARRAHRPRVRRLGAGGVAASLRLRARRARSPLATSAIRKWPARAPARARSSAALRGPAPAAAPFSNSTISGIDETP